MKKRIQENIDGEEVVKMVDVRDELNDNDKKELDRLQKEIVDEAKKVVEDYTKNPSEMSGSATQININSPLLSKKKA